MRTINDLNSAKGNCSGVIGKVLLLLLLLLLLGIGIVCETTARSNIEFCEVSPLVLREIPLMGARVEALAV